MSMGFHHTIKPNQKNERIRHLMVFDVESHIEKHIANKTIFEPFLWSAIYSRYRAETKCWIDKQYHGVDISGFWDKVERYAYNKEKLVLSSHHLEPDFVPLHGIQQLQSRGWILGKYITHNKMLYFEFSKDRRKIVITNSGNIFPGSIEKWGTALGIPKLTMPKSKQLNKQWVDYCMRDCEVLLAMWHNYLEFLDIHNMGNLQFTAASQAMTTYRHRFMPKAIAIHHDPRVMALERLSYHGGRFQALQIGKIKASPIWRLDINSMYGNIMAKTELPYELRGYQNGCRTDKLEWLMKRYAVIAELTIQSHEPFFPIIENNKVKYPTGRYTSVFCTPEINYIMENCDIRKIGKIAWYRKYPILSDYAKYFMSLRQDYKITGNKGYEELAKLFVNSLYGKFGQYGYKDEIIGKCDPSLIKYEESYNATTKQKLNYLFYGGKIRIIKRENNAYNTFVAIAAHITSQGRIQLWQLIKQAGLDNIYHVATDSLLVNETGLNNLHDKLDANKFGYLKIEDEIKRLVIKAPNDMVLDDKEKIKGISKKASKLDANTYEITAWPRFNTLLKKQELEYYYTVQVKKRLKREIFTTLDADGNHRQIFCVYE